MCIRDRGYKEGADIYIKKPFDTEALINQIMNILNTRQKRKEHAYYAPGASIAKMVEAILGDTHEVMSVCAHIDGQYGIEDLYMNVPVRLGRGGVEEVVEFDLNDEELAALRASADSVRAGLANLPE